MQGVNLDTPTVRTSCLQACPDILPNRQCIISVLCDHSPLTVLSRPDNLPRLTPLWLDLDTVFGPRGIEDLGSPTVSVVVDTKSVDPIHPWVVAELLEIVLLARMIDPVGPTLVGLPGAARLALPDVQIPVDPITVIERVRLIRRALIDGFEGLFCVQIGWLDLVVGAQCSMETRQRDQEVHDAQETSMHVGLCGDPSDVGV